MLVFRNFKIGLPFNIRECLILFGFMLYESDMNIRSQTP